MKIEDMVFTCTMEGHEVPKKLPRKVKKAAWLTRSRRRQWGRDIINDSRRTAAKLYQGYPII